MSKSEAFSLLLRQSKKYYLSLSYYPYFILLTQFDKYTLSTEQGHTVAFQ